MFCDDALSRECRFCNTIKQPSEFYSNRRRYGANKCMDCWKAYYRQKSALSYAKRKPQVLQRYRANYAGHKAKVLAHYGNQCGCCGEDEPLFLTIDHVANDGRLHRKEPGRSSHNNIYGWLVRQGFPAGFQTLCMNCNQGKHRNGGVCPHVLKVQRSSREGVGPSGPKRTVP